MNWYNNLCEPNDGDDAVVACPYGCTECTFDPQYYREVCTSCESTHEIAPDYDGANFCKAICSDANCDECDIWFDDWN